MSAIKPASKFWLVLILLLVLASFILPFTLFRHVDAWHGSFLFWSVTTAIVIAISAIVSSRWKD